MEDLYGAGGGASGGEEVIADDHAVTLFYGVFVDFERVRAIFEGVGDAGSFCGELFGFAHGDEAGAEAVSERGSEDESAGFDSGNDIDLVAVVVFAEEIDQGVEALLILQQGSEIVEENARLGIIGNFADQFLEIVHSAGSSLSQ